MDTKLSKVYCSPLGFWKGLSGIKKLAETAKGSEEKARLWLIKEVLWQTFLSAPHYITRLGSDVSLPNSVQQADLLFLPHAKLSCGPKVYKYALTVINIDSHYKEAQPLTLRDSAEAAKAFQSIYKRNPLTWP